MLKDNDLLFARLKPEAKVPSKRDEDAGFDIYPCFDEEYMIIDKHNTVLIPTGIASVISPTKYIQIQERGSTGSIGMKYGAGVIDSGYRGEWFIAITNCNDKCIVIAKNDLTEEDIINREIKKEKSFFKRFKIKRNLKKCIIYPYKKAIAQAIIHDVQDMKVKEISKEELDNYKSERGSNKLGSSNK